MRRVAVLGCAGSGKTTLARALGERLAIPVIHVDSVYWRGSDHRFGARWPTIHEELIAREAWVIDGMKPGVLAERLARADTAVFLDLPRRSCYRGLVERRLALRGRAHPELGAYDHVDRKLLRWIWRFPREVRPLVLELLRRARCDVVVLSSRAEVRRFLDGLPGHAVGVGGVDDRGEDDRHAFVTHP